MFDRHKETSAYWFNRASDLRGSAAALWVSRDPDIGKEIVKRAELGEGFSMGAATPLVYRMLCGLALELLFKACLVARRREVPTEHDLVKLAAKAGIAVSKVDESLLRILTGAIRWNGRYPVPKTKKEFDELRQLESTALLAPVEPIGKLRIMRPNRMLDWDGFERLWLLGCEVYAEQREKDR